MPQDQTRIIALVYLFFGFALGCTPSDAPQTPAEPLVEYVEIGPLIWPNVECDEDEAEQVLVIRVTVPGELDRYRFRIPFCRADVAEDGKHGPGFFCASGSNGGLSGSVGIESSTETSLSVRVDLSWTSPGVKGELDELIVIPIGETGLKEIPQDRQIEWEFEAPAQESDAVAK